MYNSGQPERSSGLLAHPLNAKSVLRQEPFDRRSYENMAITDLIGKLVDYLTSREKTAAATAAAYIAQVTDICYELIETEDPKGDRASFLHQQLKAVYESASSSILLHREEGYILFRALSSARVYYWLRVFEDQSTEEIVQLLADREERNRLSRSMGLLQILIGDLMSRTRRSTGEKVGEFKPHLLREACLYDLGRLAALGMELRARSPQAADARGNA